MKRLWGLAAAGVSLWGVAWAEPVQTTKYTFYPVSGDTAVEIYDAMLKRGPEVNGAKAYAATSAVTTQDGKLIQDSSCRIEDYRLKLEFVIKLPRIRNEKALPPADLARWRDFSAFLKTHEETHRKIWLGCAEDLERQVAKIRLKSCADAEERASRMWERMRASCNRKHEAFDAAEQRRLMAHPFVQMVYRRATAAHGARAQ